MGIRLGRDWHMSGNLLSHNCNGEIEVNIEWRHVSGENYNRFKTPMKCLGCGAKVPKDIEQAFLTVNKYWRQVDIDRNRRWPESGTTIPRIELT